MGYTRGSRARRRRAELHLQRVHERGQGEGRAAPPKPGVGRVPRDRHDGRFQPDGRPLLLALAGERRRGGRGRRGRRRRRRAGADDDDDAGRPRRRDVQTRGEGHVAAAVDVRPPGLLLRPGRLASAGRARRQRGLGGGDGEVRQHSLPTDRVHGY